MAESKQTEGKEVVVDVDIYWEPGHHATPGQRRTDVPEDSHKWLIEQGYIHYPTAEDNKPKEAPKTTDGGKGGTP